MQATYTKTLDDYVAFGRHVFTKSRLGQRGLFSRLIALIAALVFAIEIVTMNALAMDALWSSAMYCRF